MKTRYIFLDKTCETCVFQVSGGGGSSPQWAVCRRYPPTHLDRNMPWGRELEVIGYPPLMTKQTACGKYRDKEAGR